VAAAVLTALALLSPWFFGGVLPSVTLTIVVLGLLAALGAVLGGRGLPAAPSVIPVWPLAGLLVLGLAQLLPLPAVLLRTLAPGSAAVWYPARSAAAAVLGSGPHPISIHPVSTLRWLLFAFAVAALTVCAASALRRRTYALRTAVVLLGGGLAVGIYGLIAHLVFGSKLYGVFAVPTVAPFGPFVSKNHFAGYLEGLALLAVGLTAGLADQGRREPGALGWIGSARAPRVVWAAGAALALILAIGVSLSRGGVFGLGAGAVAFVIFRFVARRRRRLALRGVFLTGMALGAVAASGFFLLPGEAQSRIRGLPSASEEASGSYRLALWRDTLTLSGASPLVGYGFGAYEDAIPRFKTTAGGLRVEHAENDWLEVLAEGGLLAVGLALTLVISTLRRIMRGLREQADRALRGLGLGALAGAVALAVHSLVDFNLRIPSNALVFAGLVALAAGASTPIDKRLESPSKSVRRWIALLPAAALLSALVATLSIPWSQEAPGGSSSLHLTGVRPGAPLRQAAAAAVLTDHLRGRPADAVAWAMLAWVRAHRSPAEGRQLAEHALALDPLHPGVREAVGELVSRLPAAPGPSSFPAEASSRE
jgi:O-antigen ligase